MPGVRSRGGHPRPGQRRRDRLPIALLPLATDQSLTEPVLATLVLKFGGSSVATRERIQAVAERIIAIHERGHELAVVVSAMGDTTDELIELAGSISARPPARELDLLLSTGEITSAALMAIAICELGPSAFALTGPQGGMLTDGQFGRGRITSVSAANAESAYTPATAGSSTPAISTAAAPKLWPMSRTVPGSTSFSPRRKSIAPRTSRVSK